MHKSVITLNLFLIGSLLILPATTTLNVNLLSNAMAQEYQNDDNYNNNYDIYSEYPTKDKKIACQTGQFEGFFVESIEFCKLKIAQGPKGPIGPQGIQGPPGVNGTQGPPGNITGLCPSSTTLQLQSVPEVTSNGFVLTCVQQIFGEFTVVAIWEDTKPGNLSDSEIFFASSIDGGKTFGTPMNISNNTGFSGFPQIAVSGFNVYVVWYDETSGSGEIFIAVSTNGGQTFSTPNNISNNTGFSGFPQITTSGNNVYVVWEDISLNNILIAVSTDGGQTFSNPKNLDDPILTGITSSNPQIAVSGNNVYVVWDGFTFFFGVPDVFIAVSTDGGQTFSNPNNISHNGGGSIFPKIGAAGNNVYVVWSDTEQGNFDIFSSVSTDGGQNFSFPRNISFDLTRSIDPHIALSGNHVYVAWRDIAAGNSDIFFAVSTDGGLTFNTPINISNNTGDSRFGPRFGEIAQSGKIIYVVWQDRTPGNSEIFIVISTDFGKTFGTPKNISNNVGISEFQEIVVFGEVVYVVWADTSPGNYDIFSASSTDAGETFDTPKNISNNVGISVDPEIAVS